MFLYGYKPISREKAEKLYIFSLFDFRFSIFIYCVQWIRRKTQAKSNDKLVKREGPPPPKLRVEEIFIVYHSLFSGKTTSGKKYLIFTCNLYFFGYKQQGTKYLIFSF